MNIYEITENDIKQQLINLRQITFEVTDLCNLQCKYCYYGDLYDGYDNRVSKYLSFQKVRHMLDFLFEIWRKETKLSSTAKTYVSFYGGEPLMNMPLIQETIQYIEAAELPPSVHIIYSMTTNGVLLDKYMDYLHEKNIELLVSLDGNEAGSSYRIDHAGKNSFKKVFSNLKKLQITYPGYFEQNISFNSVLHNKNNVVETALFVKNEFGKIPNISELNGDGIKCGKENEFNCMHSNYTLSVQQSKENVKEELSLLNPDTEELKEFIETQTDNYYRDYNYLFFEKESMPTMQTGTCIPFSKKIFVTVNGKILACERISQDYFLGSVTNEGIELDCKTIAEKFNGYLKRVRYMCEVCSDRLKCMQCVYKIKTLLENKPVCKDYKGKQAFNQYTSRNLHYLSQHPHLYKKICNAEL